MRNIGKYKNSFAVLLLFCLSVLAINSCDPSIPFQNKDDGSPHDVQVPKLLKHEVKGSRELDIYFDEAVYTSMESIETHPDLAVKNFESDDTRIGIVYAEDSDPGEEYLLTIRVQDTSGNSTTAFIVWYGTNTRLPDLVINEFTTEGSRKYPDRVELYAKTAGNLAGLTFYEGSLVSWDSRIVFPSMEVEKGAYVIIHCKPSGIEAEISETTNMQASSAPNSSDTAWDFWVQDGNGIPNSNGVISIYDTPDGNIIDAVIYSTKTYTDDEHHGFSTSVFDQAEELVKQGAWHIAGAEIVPEDTIRPQDSTATRSISRNSNSEDTNSRSDWHITPTGGASFGQVNSDEEYNK